MLEHLPHKTNAISDCNHHTGNLGLNWNFQMHVNSNATRLCLWPCLPEYRGDHHTYAQKHKARIDHPPPPALNEHACQTVSQEMPTSIGTALWVVWGRCTHPSGGTDVATDSLCKHVSQSLHLWQLTVKNCEQLQSKKHRVKSQDVRRDTASTLKTDKWNPFDLSCSKSTWPEERKRKKRETDNSSLSAPRTTHSDCLLILYIPPFTLKKGWKGSVRHCRTSDKLPMRAPQPSAPSPHPLPDPVNHSEGLAEMLPLAVSSHKKT